MFNTSGDGDTNIAQLIFSSFFDWSNPQMTSSFLEGLKIVGF
jgi:hypothetical protein